MPLTVVPRDQLAEQVGTQVRPRRMGHPRSGRINTFADCTEDHQFIHIDEEKAAQTPFGGTIAHGFLTLSMLVKMCEGDGIVPENVVMGINYGFDKIRFLAPVRAGKRVRAHRELISVEAEGRQPLPDEAGGHRGDRGRGNACPGRRVAVHDRLRLNPRRFQYEYSL
jgi:acyl dehydratase